MEEEDPSPLSRTPRPAQEAVPTAPHGDPQAHLVLTRGQGFRLFLFLGILSNPDKDLEVRDEKRMRDADQTHCWRKSGRSQELNGTKSSAGRAHRLRLEGLGRKVANW